MEEKFSEFSEFSESEKSSRMNKGIFKDPLCYLCLRGAVVSSLSFIQEVVIVQKSCRSG